jgi:hypothetical protein
MEGSLSPILRLIFCSVGNPSGIPRNSPPHTLLSKEQTEGDSRKSAIHVRATSMFTNYEDFVQMTSGIDPHIFLLISPNNRKAYQRLLPCKRQFVDTPEISQGNQ